MIGADLQKIADKHSGVRAFAKRLGVSHRWVYDRINGTVSIKPLDVAAIRAKTKRKAR